MRARAQALPAHSAVHAPQVRKAGTCQAPEGFHRLCPDLPPQRGVRAGHREEEPEPGPVEAGDGKGPAGPAVLASGLGEAQTCANVCRCV